MSLTAQVQADADTDLQAIARGAVLRTWRERKHWTIAAVCVTLGVSSPRVRDIEAGDLRDAKLVRRLANLYVQRQHAPGALQGEATCIVGALLMLPPVAGGYVAAELRLIARALAGRNQRVMPTPNLTGKRVQDQRDTPEIE